MIHITVMQCLHKSFPLVCMFLFLCISVARFYEVRLSMPQSNGTVVSGLAQGRLNSVWYNICYRTSETFTNQFCQQLGYCRGKKFCNNLDICLLSVSYDSP